jgi:hypothetical protein
MLGTDLPWATRALQRRLIASTVIHSTELAESLGLRRVSFSGTQEHCPEASKPRSQQIDRAGAALWHRLRLRLLLTSAPLIGITAATAIGKCRGNQAARHKRHEQPFAI